MHIQDMANTKGHVASMTKGMFHPKQADIFLTLSLDRSGDNGILNAKSNGIDQNLPQRDVLITKDNRGLKVGVKACTYNHK